MDLPVLFANPSSAVYGTSTTSRRLDTSVLNPDPQTIPMRGFWRCSGTRRARISRVEANGCDESVIVLGNRNNLGGNQLNCKGFLGSVLDPSGSTYGDARS